jgi:hypothetical protein
VSLYSILRNGVVIFSIALTAGGFWALLILGALRFAFQLDEWLVFPLWAVLTVLGLIIFPEYFRRARMIN